MTGTPYPGPPNTIAINLDAWARRIEDKLDRFHEDTQRQLLELQRQPSPIKDGEVRVSALEAQVKALERDSELNTRFREDNAVTRRVLARGWAIAAAIGGLAASLFPLLSGR